MKSLLFVLAMAVAAACTSLPARALNLHNGVIVVRNHGTTNVRVYLEYAGNLGHVMESHDIAPGATWYSSVCCFAAGSTYRLDLRRDNNSMGQLGGRVVWGITPHLCNRNGIPYGFFDIALDDRNKLHEGASNACYDGPL